MHTRGQARRKRLLWIVHHRTLMAAEVPILESLGYDVFVPRIALELDPAVDRAIANRRQGRGLDAADVDALHGHDFYRDAWAPALADMLNARFDALVVTCSGFTAPITEAVRHFDGQIVARAFGREHPRRYSAFFVDSEGAADLARIDTLGDRFVFGQAFRNLADVEAPSFASRARTIAPPLAGWVYERSDDWRGRSGRALFACARIRKEGYYRDVYEAIKRDFGDLHHEILGPQIEPVEDPTVLGYLSDDALLDRFADAAVFVYPSSEPRHLHYSPIEAMVVGAPVLYRRDALIGRLLGGADLPGACEDTLEMRAKASALVTGDRDLATAIRAAQGVVVDHFSSDLARRQWSAALSG